MKSEVVQQKFTAWLNENLEETGWSIRELARRCGNYTGPHITNVKNGRRNVTWDLVASLAQVFGETPESAFRQIGLLPNHQIEIDKLREILNYLPDDQVAEIIKYANWKRTAA